MQFKLSILALVAFGSMLHGAGKPADDFAGAIKIFLGKTFVTDWQGIEKLPKINWAPLPPQELKNCLPDGGCFTRGGAAVYGDRKLIAIVTGARTIASNLYFRNPGLPLGEGAVLAALKEAAITAELGRCPLNATAGGTNWYRLAGGAGVNPGVLAVQTNCNGKPCEGFVLTPGKDLPPLQPNQLRFYTEQCSAAPADRKPVSTKLPHEQLADTIVALIPPSSGAALRDWKTVMALPTGIQWPAGAAPKKTDLSFKHDPNPFMIGGELTLSGREFHLMVSGSPAQAKTIYFEEGGMHPRGEHLLGVIYALGQAVKLVRCGPVYTESTNNWYGLTSANRHPVMLKQSIRFEGPRVQDSYELRLDATLPERDPRDREPGVQGCR